tara:strand:+ start:1795 stop:2049 length:255 start_codon:yes stop_codon:yes gene_type:complete
MLVFSLLKSYPKLVKMSHSKYWFEPTTHRITSVLPQRWEAFFFRELRRFNVAEVVKTFVDCPGCPKLLTSSATENASQRWFTGS